MKHVWSWLEMVVVNQRLLVSIGELIKVMVLSWLILDGRVPIMTGGGMITQHKNEQIPNEKLHFLCSVIFRLIH